MKALKYMTYAIIALVALVVVAGAAAFFLIPAERLAALASEEVKKATGRDLTISGGVSPSIFPVLGATVSGAALSNAEWATAEQMISVGEVSVGVRVAPLLSGRLEIEEIRLVDAAVALEVTAEGEPNWSFDTPSGDQSAAAGETSGGGDGGSQLERLGRVKLALENAAISYDNRATGASFTTSELTLSALLESPDAPLQVDGSGVFNGQNVSLSLNLATPEKLISGELTLTELTAVFAGAEVTYSGTVKATQKGAPPEAKGAVTATVPDIPGLLAAVGAGRLNTPDGVMRSAALDGQLTFDGIRGDLAGLALTLDEQTVSGEASIDMSGARPSVTAALQADDLDLSPYISGGGGSGDASGGGAGGGGSGGGWSTEPIDLSGLQAADADISVKARSVLLDKGVIRDADLHAKLVSGVLTLSINKLQMFDGGAVGAIRIDGSGRPAIAADVSVDSVQLLTLLSTMADFEKLEGVGAVSVDVTGQGGSLNGIMNSLAGTSAIKLTDGAILGINLAAMVRNATGAFLAGAGEAQKTDFAEISASFDIREGVAANSDLIFLGPLLRATGAGTVNIGAQTLNYRVEPRAVASLTGQGGDASLGGIAVPVLITGSWSNPKFAPDLAGAITGIVTDPASLAGTALGLTQGTGDLVGDVGTGVGGAVGGVLEGLLGGGTSSGTSSGGASSDSSTEQKQNPTDPIGGALKGLFGGN